jgi:threonine dehydrogenase-like Zn-dependent dehydrogenase
MKAVIFHGKGDVRVETVPDPSIEHPTDAIVKITTSAICGSDLHPYHGRVGVGDVFPIGHEFVGVVEAVGSEVRGVRRGDRVVAPFSVSCGACYYCRNRLPTQCETTGRGIFGMGKRRGSFPGAQAEYIRVPFAGAMLEPFAPGLGDDQMIFLADILPTGYFCAENGGIRPGNTVALFGCGPVGLCALMAAQLFGPAEVLVVDRVPYRLAMAKELGAVPIDAGRNDPLAAIRERTAGRGADVALEAVGHESALALALQAVRPGGTVSVVGVYAEEAYPFPIGQAFVRGVTFRIGTCPARAYIPQLMPLLATGRLDPTRLITHRLPLAEAPAGYQIFDRKEENALKVLLKP